MLFLVGCQAEPASQAEKPTKQMSLPSATAPQPTASLIPTEKASTEPSAAVVLPEPTNTAIPILPTTPSRHSTLRITPPADWFFTQNRYDDLLAVIYTNYDPEEMILNENLSNIPQNFAVAALAISPLPEDSDPEALHAGMTANLDNYGSQDIEAMLVIADQIGVLDLTAVEGIDFISAQIDVMAEHEALRLEGIIALDGEDHLHAQIWLTWTSTSFVSLFEMTHTESWAAMAEVFSQTRETMQLP